ncbi:MAG: GNAT family N-acetyltransferase [Devosia sp.]
MSWTIRRLSSADVEAYRAIRLEALTNHPEAFTRTAEDFALQAVVDLGAVLDKLTFFGAETPEGDLVGIMAFDQGQKRESHRGWLIQVYVQPAVRGTGCALALLEAVLDHARGKVLQVHLGVGANNAPALGFYQKAGFEIYGTDPRFMAVNGRYIDEHMMVRFLDKAPGK